MWQYFSFLPGLPSSSLFYPQLRSKASKLSTYLATMAATKVFCLLIQCEIDTLNLHRRHLQHRATSARTRKRATTRATKKAKRAIMTAKVNLMKTMKEYHSKKTTKSMLSGTACKSKSKARKCPSPAPPFIPWTLKRN